MKIGIDISQIVYGTGVSVYTRDLVEALLRQDERNEYLLFGAGLRRRAELNQAINYYQATARGNSQGMVVPLPPILADFLWNRLHLLPIEKLIGPIEVFHSSDWTQPPTKAAKVTTIHDLAFLRWPESVHPQVLAAQKRRLQWVKKEVDLVIAVSEATKKETVELLGIPEKKIVVIYEGIPRDALELAKSRQPLAGLAALKKRRGIKKPYIFAYGSSAPRKNVERLIKAFAQVRKKLDCQLVIVGEYQPKQKLPGGVVLTGFLPRKQMLSLFAQAEVLAFPSLSEGFGLIILEAFALGVPVVTSRVSSMPEVAGEAAVLIDPLAVDSLAQGIIRAMKNRQPLVRAGLKRVRQFSWAKAAKETLRVYEEAFTEHQSLRI